MSPNPKLPIVIGPLAAGDDLILSPDALAFVGHLVREFGPRVTELLARRVTMQAAYDAGQRPDFAPETAAIRDSEWTVAALPADLMTRVVEITGPVERKMIINALNSGADVFMADFEDSTAPTWRNVVDGQRNLYDAVRGTISYEHPQTGKRYQLNPRTATLMVRPRGWHLSERHVHLDGRPVAAALFDFGLYFFHNARALMDRDTGPYFYLPKLQSHLEAQLWNDVFVSAQQRLGVPRGTIKATVLIETLPAVFQMHEILHALRDHAAGLNCGRWDYIFSYIKTLRAHPEHVLPDRSEVGMTQPFMRAYTQLLVQTCHRRGAFAMGGMAAQIPIKGDDAANTRALDKVRADKAREAEDGHDGTWVAHPGLVAIARDAFTAVMSGDNQLAVTRDDVRANAAQLIETPQGTRTDAGLRHNIRVGVQYLEAWLGGVGCVPLYDLMEDAATAEISRSQIWQWLRHDAITEDGRPVTVARVLRTIDEELDVIRSQIGDQRFESGEFERARALFIDVCTNTDEFIEFLTLPAYDALLAAERLEP